MEIDLLSLAAEIRRVFPTSNLSAASEPDLKTIRERYPGVPEHYLTFLRQVGYGPVGDNFMIYSGLVEADEIFNAGKAAGLDGVVFLGDNFAGCVVGFDTRSGWRLISLDDGYGPEPLPEDAKTVGEFLAERLARCERD